MVHVRFEGKSFDSTRRELGILQRDRANDRAILNQIARSLNVPAERFRFYVVDRPATGDLIVRPEAVYG